VAEGDLQNAQLLLEKALPCFDKAAAMGVIHKATASRKISRLVKLVNSLGSA
jgi:small subunit ribosomal protein S20